MKPQKGNASPPTFDKLVDVVEKHTTRGLSECGWRICTKDEFIFPNQLHGYPYANADFVGIHLAYKKGDITVSGDVTSKRNTTWADLLPTVSWTRSVQNRRHEFLLRLARTPLFTYSFYNPQFTCISQVNLLDGFRSKFSASTQLCERSHFGVSAEYDPSRSGLVDYTLAVSRLACHVVWGGDFLVQYNAACGMGVHLRVPLSPYLSAVALLERGRVIAGAETQSPCGAQLLVNVDLVSQRGILAVARNIGDIWKLTMSYSAPMPGGSSDGCPKFGLVFSSQFAD